MNKSTNYNFNLPNSANDEIADINDISDNFVTIDSTMKTIESATETASADIEALKSGKVDKIPGKGLSSNDYTDTEKEKLQGIETGATRNTIDQTFSATSHNAQSGKAVAEAVKDKQDIIEIPVDDFTIDADFLSGYGNQNCFIATSSFELKYVSGIDSSGTKSIVTVGNTIILKGSTIQFNQSDQYEFNFKISGALAEGYSPETVWFRYNIDLSSTTEDYTSFYLYKESVFQDIASKVNDISSSSTYQQYPSAKAVYNYVTNVVSTEQTRANNTFANALKGTKSDTVILIDDVSPVTHEMGVKVRSKNLFDKDNANILNAYFTSSGDVLNTNATSTRSIWIPCLPNTTYTVSKMKSARFAVGFTSEEPTNGVTVNNVTMKPTATEITVTSGNSDKYIIVWFYHSSYDTSVTVEKILASIQIELGTTATDYTPYVDLTAVKVSRCGKNLFDKSIPYSDYLSYSGGYAYLSIYVGKGSTVTVSLPQKYSPGLGGYFYCRAFNGNSTGTSQEWVYHNSVAALCQKSVTLVSQDGFVSLFMTIDAYNDFKDEIMVEIGSTATDYEPYIAPSEYTPAADGTVEGVTSLYPNTTLMTDTDGVIIDCEYNRDINKAFAALEAAIATNNS